MCAGRRWGAVVGILGASVALAVMQTAFEKFQSTEGSRAGEKKAQLTAHSSGSTPNDPSVQGLFFFSYSST